MDETIQHPNPDEVIEFRPQPGPQTDFLFSSADVAFYGGSAGGGKTYAILMDPLRKVHNPGFGGVIFRRETPQIINEGGLWDESENIYPFMGGVPSKHKLLWTFPSGAKIQFRHMEQERDRYAWQGAQIPYIAWDEITHFTATQFWYLFSRSRSTCGVRPYIRATCNPDPDSFVASLVSWWIDQDTGFAIKERSGVIRWFIRLNDDLVWGDSKEELLKKHPSCHPKSFTFIRASLSDNKILLAKDPDYLASLNAMAKIDRARLLDGNWNVRAIAGAYFQKGYFDFVDAAPVCSQVIRYWDRAGTVPRPGEDPDWTVGLKLGKAPNGLWFVLDVERFRGTPLTVKERIKTIASQDGKAVMIGIEQDPGQAGISEADDHVKNLAGYSVKKYPVSKAKEVRAKPVSAQAEARNIKIVRGRWNDTFLAELESFDGKGECHDDQVDALSGAFNALTATQRVFLV